MKNRIARRPRWRLGTASAIGLLILGTLWAGACSSPSSGAHSYGPPGKDAGANADAGTIPDAQCERTDAGYCALPPCSKADAAYFCAAGDCLQSWPTDGGSFCGPYPPGGAFSPSIEDCGSYHVLTARSTNDLKPGQNTYYYYYDKTTGALVAVVHVYASNEECLVGPPGFQPPVSCSGYSDVC